jgi:hypothetical protein
MRVQDVLCDRQPQTRSTLGTRPAQIHPEKSFGHATYVLGSNAYARI